MRRVGGGWRWPDGGEASDVWGGRLKKPEKERETVRVGAALMGAPRP